MILKTWSLEELQLAKLYLESLLDKVEPETIWCNECRDLTTCHNLPDDTDDPCDGC